RCWPTQSVPSAQVRPESAPCPGAGMLPSTSPVSRSIFWIMASAIWYRCLPSKAVPACAATSILRAIFPLSGSRALSRSPLANQTCRPSKLTPCTLSAPGKGPYSRLILAGERFMATILADRQRSGEQQACRESRHARRDPAAGPPTAKRLDLAGRGERLQRALDGARTATERQRQCRTRPRLAVGKQCQHPDMGTLERRRQHDDRSRPARRQQEAALRRVQFRQRREGLAQPPDLHA